MNPYNTNGMCDKKIYFISRLLLEETKYLF